MPSEPLSLYATNNQAMYMRSRWCVRCLNNLGMQHEYYSTALHFAYQHEQTMAPSMRVSLPFPRIGLDKMHTCNINTNA
jgi:hypothetical protein